MVNCFVQLLSPMEYRIHPGVNAVFHWGEKLNKAIDHMIEVFTEEYYKVTVTQLNAQKEMINELSAPIMPIADGIGILPLVGEIDTSFWAFNCVTVTL